MTRRTGSATAAIVLIASMAAGGCRRPSPAVDRERAYRANNLGVALLEQFRFDAAAAAFREALRIAPGLPLAQLNLAISLFYAQDVPGAAREAAEAARLMPSALQPAYLLGLIARSENREQDALREFERVRRIDPRDPGTAINLAQIHLQNRRYADAIAILRPAVADEPFNITAAYNLGLALTRAGQREEGQRLMEQSQALRATGYGVTLSNAYLEQGRYAEAVASTGSEPDLVQSTVPPVRFTASPLTPAASRLAAASPFGQRFTASDLTPDGMRRIAAGLGGALTMVDIDGDGDLDLVVATATGQRLYRNDAGTFTDITGASGLGTPPPDAVPIGVIAADVDNDGAPDLFVLRDGVSSLYHNAGGGRFVDVTAKAGFAPYPFLPGAAALVDVDHDGDLDLVIAGLADLAGSRARTGALVFPKDFAPAPLRLYRNNGDGTFTDITRAANIESSGHTVAIVPTDFDNRRDVDLLLVDRNAPPRLFKNLRDGTFRDVAADVGLTGVASDDEITSVAAGDVNKDGYPDLFFGRRSGPGVFALSDGRARFTIVAAPPASAGVDAAQLVDYDADGLLDLFVWRSDGPRILRSLGAEWTDVTPTALPARGGASPLVSARGLAIADVASTGFRDAIALLTDGSTVRWRNGGDSRQAFVQIRLKARVSNRSGVGTKIQIRAGSLTQTAETSAASPPVAPADVVFGLGPRPGADVAQLLWPSGILQAEYAGSSAAGPAPTAPSPLPRSLLVEELDRKPSSCPFLFAWNGERFTFVTDFMGGGEMGYWEAPAVRNTPDPIEYVRIRGDQLRARDGRYDIRVTNELEETVFVDRLQLWSIVHPADVEVFPNEGMADPPKPFRIFAVKSSHVPSRATDNHGHDVTDRIARIDRRYPDDFELKPFRGYASEHTLTVDVGSSRILLLTGWTDYAFSSDNVAANQAGMSLSPPSLQVKDDNGVWHTRIADIGIPVGRPQTIVVDLTPVLQPGEHEVRVVTNMRIYWDRILVGTLAHPPARIIRIDPAAAELRVRGFSKELKPDGREPITYDYDSVTTESPWKTMTGRYTRTGDVRALLSRADDMFVIMKPGDEIALAFDASREDAPPAGWTRTFLLLADGFSKEMDINSASPDGVGPLPYHRMTRYPYEAPEHYPADAAHERYLAEYNTRIGGTGLPDVHRGRAYGQSSTPSVTIDKRRRTIR